MAPIAVTPDNSSPNGDVLNGYFTNRLGSAAMFGRANGGPNGRTVNGSVNGLTNGHTNGVNGSHGVNGINGHANGFTNGHTNGHSPPNPQKPMPIAIVGMACRLPGNVSTPGEFWELCTRARTGWSEVPKERFNNGRFYHPNAGKGGCQNAVGGNFLNVDLAAFDAPFFGLTEKEAISMDPQQRLLLECTFEALESAGIPKHTIVGKDVGVFVGGSFPEYESHLFRDSDSIPMHQATGLPPPEHLINKPAAAYRR